MSEEEYIVKEVVQSLVKDTVNTYNYDYLETQFELFERLVSKQHAISSNNKIKTHFKIIIFFLKLRFCTTKRHCTFCAHRISPYKQL